MPLPPSVSAPRDDAPFIIGDRVVKTGTGYGGPGIVRDTFQLTDGQWRIVVAHKIDGGWGELLHIYSPVQLEKREEALADVPDDLTLDRYRYAVHFASADAWDGGPDIRRRFEWARANDPQGRLTDNQAAVIGQRFLPTDTPPHSQGVNAEGGAEELAERLAKHSNSESPPTDDLLLEAASAIRKFATSEAALRDTINELREEQRIFDDLHRDKQRTIDRAAELMGIPADGPDFLEIDQTDIELWFDRMNIRAELAERQVAALKAEIVRLQGNQP